MYGFRCSNRTNSGYHFCAEDGLERRRIFHSSYYRYTSQCDDEIIGYATININMEAFYGALSKAMPQLATPRIRLTGFELDNYRMSQLSCPVLTHLELYVTTRKSCIEKVASGVYILNWVTNHFEDFSKPLETLLVVGVRLGSDVGVLDTIARALLLTPTSLFEYVFCPPRHSFCDILLTEHNRKRAWPHSPLAPEFFDKLQIGPTT